MINRKIKKLLSSTLGIALIIGIMQTPALADDTVQATSSNNPSVNANQNKNYIISKDNDIQKNGLKISIDKIIATKHKLKATVTVQSQSAINESKGQNVIAKLTYGENKFNSEGLSYGMVDDKTIKIDFEREADNEEIPEKGELRIDIVIPQYKINVGLDAKVDFSESFKNTIEKDVSVKVPEFGFTMKKLESNIMGTTIIYGQPASEYEKRIKNDSLHLPVSAFILKVGDKMYRTTSSGGYSLKEEEGVEFEGFEAQAATYEKVKDQKDISIIPVVCNMNWNDVTRINDSYKKKDTEKDAANKVSYTKYFDFSDGSKGEIYNIEREDGVLKVYCKGNSETESLLMASNMFMYYNLEDGKIDYSGNIDDINMNMSFYKDPKDTLGYIVEFDNVEKDKTVELNFEYVIKQIDKFKVGNEIQISK